MKNFVRILLYILGLLFMGFGTAFAVNSNLGVSPINSLPYAISMVGGISMGVCVTGVFSCYVLVQLLILRKKFPPKGLLQIVFASIFGYFVDFAKVVVGDTAIPGYFGQLAMLCASIFFVALGLVFYLGADIVPLPMEGMALTIASKLKGIPFHYIKISLDGASVLLAVGITFIGLGSVSGVREGTIIAALLTGKVMAVLSKPIKPWLQKIAFD